MVIIRVRSSIRSIVDAMVIISIVTSMSRVVVVPVVTGRGAVVMTREVLIVLDVNLPAHLLRRSTAIEIVNEFEKNNGVESLADKKKSLERVVSH